jgi:thiamine-phosphate pyrophosphorylase
MKNLTAEYGVPLIINDRLDIALAVQADGIHIGQDDLPLPVARKLLGPDKIIGYSVSNIEEACYGEKHGADYLGAGPVFTTATKKVSTPTLGPAGLKRIKSIPVVGIGGINLENIKEVRSTGIDGVSIVSGILGSDRPGHTALLIRRMWDNG